MHKNLNKTTNTENNKVRVNMIKNNLASLIEKFKSNSASDEKRKKIKKKKKDKSRNNMIKIVERILYFNHLNQAGQG